MIGVPSRFMSDAVPPDPAAVPAATAPSRENRTVLRVNAPHVVTFFATLWTSLAAVFGLCRYISTLLGAPAVPPGEYPFDAAIYLLWVPLVPFVVRMARRFAPERGRRLRIALAHAAIAIVVILAKLFAHRLIFCYAYSGGWGQCVLGVRLELWLVNWYFCELFVYAATSGGTSRAASRRRRSQ
jgi:hypothetical protein